MLIALVGNPNTGKTTIFNGLCRSRQRTGNFPGTTIEKKSGLCQLSENLKVDILDLPGIYSLNVRSLDEKITYQSLTNNFLNHVSKNSLEKAHSKSVPDLVLFILDATNLRRNLFLYTQLSELGLPIFLVLTMKDRLLHTGTSIDIEKLETLLSVPIVSVNALDIKEIQNLRVALAKYLSKKNIKKNHTVYESSHPKEKEIISKVESVFLKEKKKLNSFQIREFLLSKSEENPNTLYSLKSNKNKEQVEKIKASYRSLLDNQPALDSLSRYRWIENLVKKCYRKNSKENLVDSQKLDHILTHGFWGFGVFAGLMYFLFSSIYTWAKPFMDMIENAMGWFSGFIASYLTEYPILTSLVQDGIIGGVGSVLVFLPQIAILFFFISILEDSGYLVRAAYLMDRLLSWTGLNGRSFVPLLSSFACAVPGIMATRVMPEGKARLSTILIAPLMSCSARLPIYLLFIGALIEPYFGPAWATFSLFFMHIIGVLVALPLVWIFHKGSLKKNIPDPFFMEFPPLRKPLSYNVYRRVSNAVKRFIGSAGGVILLFSIIIWALASFPKSPNHSSNLIQENLLKSSQKDYFISELHAYDSRNPVSNESSTLEKSYLGKIGKALAPFFAPLGFDWKITIAVLSAFPAREVLITSLGVIYNIEKTAQDDSHLRARLRNEKYPNGKPVYTPIVALSLMIFFALCSQCMGTLVVIRKELGAWKWPIFVFVYMTSLAYVFAFITYQVGGLFLF